MNYTNWHVNYACHNSEPYQSDWWTKIVVMVNYSSLHGELCQSWLVSNTSQDRWTMPVRIFNFSRKDGEYKKFLEHSLCFSPTKNYIDRINLFHYNEEFCRNIRLHEYFPSRSHNYDSSKRNHAYHLKADPNMWTL